MTRVVYDEAVSEAFGPNVAGVLIPDGAFDDVHIDDSDICEDCGNRHGLHCPEMVTRQGDGHLCRGCEDSWTETRTADSVDTVRWPGWLA